MIYIFGDSHTDRLEVSSLPNNKITYCSEQGKTAWAFDYSKYDILQNLNSSDVIIPWLGYVDIKNRLPKTLNTDECVLRYMNKTFDYFPNNRIIFMEPFPQFKVYMGKNTGGYVPYDERLLQHNIFVESLHKYCEKFGLDKPVPITKIINLDVNRIQHGVDDHIELHHYRRISNYLKHQSFMIE
jgi:hypothetical protein